jgi:hypothetical protein
MDQNLRRAVERVNAWHLARVLARTASLDADTRDDLPVNAQPSTSLDDADPPADRATVKPPASGSDERQRMH